MAETSIVCCQRLRRWPESLKGAASRAVLVKAVSVAASWLIVCFLEPPKASSRFRAAALKQPVAPARRAGA